MSGVMYLPYPNIFHQFFYLQTAPTYLVFFGCLGLFLYKKSYIFLTAYPRRHVVNTCLYEFKILSYITLKMLKLCSCGCRYILHGLYLTLSFTFGFRVFDPCKISKLSSLSSMGFVTRLPLVPSGHLVHKHYISRLWSTMYLLYLSSFYIQIFYTYILNSDDIKY